MSKVNRRKIIEAINKHHILLVFPIKNKKQPQSLWSSLYPRSQMVWEWNEDSDDRIGELWQLREEVSRSDEVVYSKWFKNRATFFSKKAFVQCLACLDVNRRAEVLSPSSREVMELLYEESPKSTKQIKKDLEWQGRMMEPHFNRAMRPLWDFLQIVGWGEADDSSFPSLNIAATKNIFEDLWMEAEEVSVKEAKENLQALLNKDNEFFKWAMKLSQNETIEKTLTLR